jgi:hypothetical protein
MHKVFTLARLLESSKRENNLRDNTGTKVLLGYSLEYIYTAVQSTPKV